MNKRISVSLKRAVRERARGYCEYCMSPEIYSTYAFSVDHIVPPGKGGTNDIDNLALACQGCNSHKYNKTSAEDLLSGDVVSLFNPRKDMWRDHFFWSEDYMEIIGKTPTGRVTIEALKLNRTRLVNLRRGLYQLGEHPPDI